MPKRTLGLIIVLITITGGLVLLSVSNLKPTSPTVPSGKQTASYAKTTLTILPTPKSVGKNLYEVPVTIDSKNKVSAVQLELTFDPKALSNVDISTGTFFKSPTVLLKKVNTETGRITYAFGLGLGQDTVSGTGTVAVIRFSPNVGFKTTQINFLPRTQVAAIDQRRSVLSTSTSALINLEALSPVTSATPTTASRSGE